MTDEKFGGCDAVYGEHSRVRAGEAERPFFRNAAVWNGSVPPLGARRELT
jgi:hypothetical protein